MLRIFSRISYDRQIEVIRSLNQVGILGNDYLLLTVLSSVIATFGLVLDSAAVIIGAMLIAPLMAPILHCALSLVRGNVRQVGRALLTLAVGAVFAIGLSSLLGTLVSTGAYNFLEELPREVLGRTQPNLFDLVVALAGGTAAAYAISQPHLSTALPGVAIATALMPPVCTVGIGLSQGRFDVSGGAMLLFLANIAAILFASSLTFALVGFRPALPERRLSVLAPVLLIEGVLVLLLIVVLSGLMVRIIGEARENRVIRATLIAALEQQAEGSLVSFERQIQPDHLAITATIRAGDGMSSAEAAAIQRELVERLQRSVALRFLVIPVTSLEPLVPPAPTGASAAAPTATSTPQPAPSATPLPTPSATLQPSPIALPSATPKPTAAVAAPTAPAGPSYAVIGATGGRGVNVRLAPGGALVAVQRDGTVVQLLSETQSVDGLFWREVVLADGRVGWIAVDYLVPYRPFVAP